MSDYEPYLLAEAVLSLYPAGADGMAITSAAVWWGACANRLRMRMDLEEVRLKRSGARYTKTFHIDEEHAIEVERTWVVQKNAPNDFVPGRNQQYVLEIVWAALRAGLAPVWHRRTYFGVTGRSIEWDSRGVLQIINQQQWRAQRFTDGGGLITVGSVYTPLTPTGDRQPVGFFREAPFIVGEYLLGVYRWPVAATVVYAKLVAFAGQGASTVVELEVDGVLTGVQLTLLAGVANTEVTATGTFSYAIAALATVRWKIISGPAPENATWTAALVMELTA